MKRLAILRHAKSSWDDADADDFDRPLNERGRRSTKVIGPALKQRVSRFDAVIASPAARVRETLDLLQSSYGELPAARFDEALYGADVSVLMSVVRAFDEDVEIALLAGHNPGLHELILALAGPQPLRQALVPRFPTGAVALLTLPIVSWGDLRRGTADISAVILPRNFL